MSITKDQIIETISAMSVMEIAELIAEIEKKFGISATSVVTETAIDDVVDNTVEEKTEFDVVLQSIGSNKIAVIKAVRSAIGLGLKEAKDMVESVPVLLKEGINKDSAEILKKALEEAGAEVELK